MTEPSQQAATDCDEAIRRLYDFLDGEMTPDRRARVSAHVDACSHCLEAYGFESELRALVSRRCREQVPPGLRDRIRRMLSEELS